MIFISFSSGEDALSNDVNIYHTLGSQGTENPTFRFLGTPGILVVWFYGKHNKLLKKVWKSGFDQ